MRPESLAIHAGYDGDGGAKARAVPIYQTAAYEFDSADHAAALFDLEVPGNIYSRTGNPTNAVLGKRVAALEGGLAALTVSSGMSAVYYSIATIVEPGTNIVSVPQLYEATYNLFAHIFPKQALQTHFAASDAPNDVERVIDGQTRAIYCESIGNPAGNIADIEGLAAVAHRHGIPLIVDNTVATPILLRPIGYGADVVIHSLTKFIGGHGTSLGGVIVDSGKFPWRDHPSRFPMLNSPEPSYHNVVYVEQFGDLAYQARCRTVCQRTPGSVLSPFNAFLLLQGIETLPLRIDRHTSNARRVAEFLYSNSRVDWVDYAGFKASPYYRLAERYLAGRPPALMTFGVKGGLAAGKRFYDGLKFIKRMVNLGDVMSLACHPASTTHRQLSPEDLQRTGVLPEAIRLSVGIEHIDDILEDLDQALTAC
jgi:O-acetylhomoserine (thiol)-lyase